MIKNLGQTRPYIDVSAAVHIAEALYCISMKEAQEMHEIAVRASQPLDWKQFKEKPKRSALEKAIRNVFHALGLEL